MWYHGDAVKRTTFADQKWDRDADRDPNAQGPGIYWTSDHQQARGYAYPTGYVYTAKIKGNFVTDTTPSDKQFLRKLIAACPEEDRIYGLSNFDENPSRALRKAVDAYSSETFINGALSIYHDFFRNDSKEWVPAMVALGVDGFLHILDSVQHLIVYNPETIKVTKEEHYSQVDKEGVAPSWMHEALKERQMTNLKKAIRVLGADPEVNNLDELREVAKERGWTLKKVPGYVYMHVRDYQLTEGRGEIPRYGVLVPSSGPSPGKVAVWWGSNVEEEGYFLVSMPQDADLVSDLIASAKEEPGPITWIEDEENEDLLIGTVDEGNVEFRIDTRPIPSLPRQRSPGLPADTYRVGVRTVGQREWTHIDETYSLEEAKQVAEEYLVVEILNR